MSSVQCPSCGAPFRDQDLADGWCPTCGKQIPRFVLTGSLSVRAPDDSPRHEQARKVPEQGKEPGPPDPLADPRPHVRMEAVRALGKSASPTSAERDQLERVAASDADPVVRHTARELLADLQRQHQAAVREQTEIASLGPVIREYSAISGMAVAVIGALSLAGGVVALFFILPLGVVGVGVGVACLFRLSVFGVRISLHEQGIVHRSRKGVKIVRFSEICNVVEEVDTGGVSTYCLTLNDGEITFESNVIRQGKELAGEIYRRMGAKQANWFIIRKQDVFMGTKVTMSTRTAEDRQEREQGREALRPFLTALRDPQPHVRWDAARKLGEMGPAARDALPLLREMANDGDPLVRRAVDDALRQIERS